MTSVTGTNVTVNVYHYIPVNAMNNSNTVTIRRVNYYTGFFGSTVNLPAICNVIFFGSCFQNKHRL